MTDELFYAKHIGGKMPSFDVFAEVNDDATPFPLYIQVKTTQKDDKYNKNSIKTPVPTRTIKELAAKPIPTYVGGYDLDSHILYIAPVFSGAEHYPAIPLNHKIELFNKANAIVELQNLKNDVINFFKNKSADFQDYKNKYVSQL